MDQINSLVAYQSLQPPSFLHKCSFLPVRTRLSEEGQSDCMVKDPGHFSYFCSEKTEALLGFETRTFRMRRTKPLQMWCQKYREFQRLLQLMHRGTDGIWSKDLQFMRQVIWPAKLKCHQKIKVFLSMQQLPSIHGENRREWIHIQLEV